MGESFAGESVCSLMWAKVALLVVELVEFAKNIGLVK
jgi:hypothetical protein